MTPVLSDTVEAEGAVGAAPKRSTPTIGTIALRFVTMLAGCVALLTWFWSR